MIKIPEALQQKYSLLLTNSEVPPDQRHQAQKAVRLYYSGLDRQNDPQAGIVQNRVTVREKHSSALSVTWKIVL